MAAPLHDATFIQAPVAQTASHRMVTRSVFEQQGMQLASRYGMTAGRCRFWCGLVGGRELLKVQSRHDSTTHYGVTYDFITDRVTSCSCPSWGACWHIGVARLWVERRKVRSQMAARES